MVLGCCENILGFHAICFHEAIDHQHHLATEHSSELLYWEEVFALKIYATSRDYAMDVRMVFTMPHQLNGLAKANPYAMYNCLIRSSWSSLKECSADERNLGALPGAVMVLHTFGSDLKYHCHVHTLVTFGGIDAQGRWCWPKRSKKLIAYRQIRAVFRTHFLNYLEDNYDKLLTRISYDSLEEELMKKPWCVHAEPPTANTKVLEEYLGKDIPPIAHKVLQTLVAINQIMQHSLPLNFQKSRYYGLHATPTSKKLAQALSDKVKKVPNSIRTLFQILKTMLAE